MSRRAAAFATAVVLSLSSSGCEEGEGGPTSPEPGGSTSAQIDRVEIVSVPAANGTYLAGEELIFSVLVTSGEAVETTGEVFLIFDLGLASQPAALSTSEAGRLEFRYQIRRGDYDGDGISIPEGELMLGSGASLQIGGTELDREVAEVPADTGHRVFALYSPGESLVFDTTLDRFPLESLGLNGAIGCAEIEDFTGIVEAVLEGNAAGAATLFQVAWQTGRCATLGQGAPAIFLSAAIAEHRNEIYDLVLAYGPGAIGGSEPTATNWWTLADFLAEPP